MTKILNANSGAISSIILNLLEELIVYHKYRERRNDLRDVVCDVSTDRNSNSNTCKMHKEVILRRFLGKLFLKDFLSRKKNKNKKK